MQENGYPVRKQHRWKEYDYSTVAFYFITIVTQGRECLFGEIKNGQMQLNKAGEMIKNTYYKVVSKYETGDEHLVVVMPNHIHFIFHNSTQTNVPTVIQIFKRLTTNGYINGVRNENWHPFHQKLWQRNYYDHVIRNQRAYEYIADYIIHNPERWLKDKLNRLCDPEQTENINERIKELET